MTRFQSVNDKINSAQGKHTSIKLLWRYARDENVHVRCAVAKNYEATPDILREILSHPLAKSYPSLIASVLKHHRCPVEYFHEYINSGSLLIILAIVINPQCPEDVLRKAYDLKLTHKYKVYIRTHILYNAHCPGDVMEKAARLKEPEIHRALVNNPNCPSNALVYVHNHHDLSEYILHKLMQHGNCPDWLRVMVA